MDGDAGGWMWPLIDALCRGSGGSVDLRHRAMANPVEEVGRPAASRRGDAASVRQAGHTVAVTRCRRHDGSRDRARTGCRARSCRRTNSAGATCTVRRSGFRPDPPELDQAAELRGKPIKQAGRPR